MISKLESHPDKKANCIRPVLGIHSVPRASLCIAVNREMLSSAGASLMGGCCATADHVASAGQFAQSHAESVDLGMKFWLVISGFVCLKPEEPCLSHSTETDQLENIFLIPRTFCFLILFLMWELNVLLLIPFDTLGLTLHRVNWGKRLYNVVACVSKSKWVLLSVRTASYHNSHDRLWWQTGLQSAA